MARPLLLIEHLVVTSVVAVENGPIPRSTTATVSMARGQDRAGRHRPAEVGFSAKLGW